MLEYFCPANVYLDVFRDINIMIPVSGESCSMRIQLRNSCPKGESFRENVNEFFISI